MNDLNEISQGVYKINDKLYTKDLFPNYNLFKENKIECGTLREWNPFHSKLAAGFKKGLNLEIKKNTTILYLGSAEGQTAAHVSDIIGDNGIIFCIDLSEIAMQKLTKLAETRENIFPVLSDANKTENYSEFIEDESCDALFADVSQRNQAEIFVKNARFLKKGHYGALSLKTKSISQGDSKKTLEIEKQKLKEVFEITQIINIAPFEKHHYLILVKKK